ncbi:MAG: helix-turn-helix transcriptional regulator [Pseudomonadota bacterium]
MQLNSVSRWETGRRTISLEDAAKIARVLNISRHPTTHHHHLRHL